MIEFDKKIIGKVYKGLVINFYHFIGVYLAYVFRAYFEVGHIPFWKHPVYYELTEISKSWELHYHYVEFSCVLLFFGAFIWMLITGFKLWTLLRKRSNQFGARLNWEYLGFLGFCISYWLVYVSSFGVFQWFSD